MFCTDYHSHLGKLWIAGDGEAIRRVSFDGQKHSQSFENLVRNDDLPIFTDVKNWLDDYFAGLNPKINFRLKPQGTDFRLKVWRILFQIPYAKTRTYGEIASEISPTMSARAVGGAVGHNPIAIIIPCHRVVGSNGKLTGYAAGIDRKIELLKLEKSNR